METRKEGGAAVTSSFETEIRALRLAVGWLVEQQIEARVLICSDSKSALAALDSVSYHLCQELERVRELIEKTRCPLCFLWVPSHCGLPGNELADSAAKEAAEGGSSESHPVTFSAAKALIARTIVDPPVTHPRSVNVYSRPPRPAGSTRKEQVLLAQLRSGHCRALAAYGHSIGAVNNPMCPRCGEMAETVEHLLQESPDTAGGRLGIFGMCRPPLSVLSEAPWLVLTFCRELKLL